jgi:hypothetical protein
MSLSESARLTLSSATALLLLGGAPMAHAQSFDPFERLGTLQGSDNPFGRDRNIGVAERPRPEYEAVPIKAGSLAIMPQLVAGLELNDNIYALSSPRVNDEILRIRPRLRIARPSPNLALSLAGEYDGTRYFRNSTENTNDYTAQGNAHYTISRDTIFDLGLVHSRESEDRASPDSLAGLARPNRFYRSEAYGALTHSFNRLRLRGTLDYERRNYLSNRDGAGNMVDQNFRDRSTLTGAVIAEYGLSPSFALFVAGSANQRDYRTRIGPVPARDSSGYEAAFGANFELGRLMRGSLRLGYLEQDYKDPVFRDVDGLLIRGELAYFVTPLVTLTAKVDRDVAETGVIEAAGYVRTTTSLRADYELLRNLILRAQVGNEHRSFVGADRRDDRFTGDLGATWLLSPRWSLQMGFSHRGQDSKGLLQGRDFSENRLSLGAVFKGL